MLRAVIARAILAASFSTTLLISRVLRFRRRPLAQSRGCVLVTGTFFNLGWFRSHAEPLGRCCRRVVFVADEPLVPPERVEFARPPRCSTACDSRPRWLPRSLS